MQRNRDRHHNNGRDAYGTLIQRVTTGLRLLLGGLFIYASWDKILHPAAFAQIIANYQILPSQLVSPAAVILPWIEALCGLALITGLFARGAVVIVTALMTIFIGALLFNLARGLDINCGCFSVAQEAAKGPLVTILRDFGIWVMAAFVMTRQLRPQSK